MQRLAATDTSNNPHPSNIQVSVRSIVRSVIAATIASRAKTAKNKAAAAASVLRGLQ
jgi:hypothetical protein